MLKLVSPITHPHGDRCRRNAGPAGKFSGGSCSTSYAPRAWVSRSLVDDWPPAPIRTARLVLRAPEARDREEFLDLGSSDEVNHHLGGGRTGPSWTAAMPDVPADRPGQFVMEHEGRFVGWVGLGRRDPARPGGVVTGGVDLELSYVLPVHAWGHGYATEAATAVLAWADAHLGEPVLVCTQVSNLASLRLAARLGFTEVARFEEFEAEQWFGVRRPG